jgi:hypothetical protein
MNNYTIKLGFELSTHASVNYTRRELALALRSRVNNIFYLSHFKMRYFV